MGHLNLLYIKDFEHIKYRLLQYTWAQSTLMQGDLTWPDLAPGWLWILPYQT